jgi:hypothetical protein
LNTKFKFGNISPQHDEYSKYLEKEIIGEVKKRKEKFISKNSIS